MSDLLFAIVAVIVGIAGTMTVYWLLNAAAVRLPRRVGDAVQPWVFVGPVVLLISLFLVYPAVQTVRLSFMEEDIAGNTTWVGLANFQSLFAEETFREMLTNNLMWIVIVPFLTVVLGLTIANFSNNVGKTSEKIYKSIIFMPMSISFVSAATIWRYIYAYNPEGQEQVGLLNALWSLFGGTPQPWMSISDGKLNSLLLMVIFIWLNAGYAMVLLSAAIKAVPEETLEAGRVDGANSRQVFFRIVLPQIWPTALAVFITQLINVMKIFDIVLAMTGGNYGTNVLAQSFYNEYFIYGNTGRAMATVVVLVVAIIPVMIYQIRHYKKMEAMR